MGGFKFTSEEVPKVKSLVAAPDYLSQPNQEKVRRLWMASNSYQKLTPDQQVDFVRQLDQRLRSRQPKAEPAPVPQGFDLKAAQARADAEFKAAHAMSLIHNHLRMDCVPRARGLSNGHLLFQSTGKQNSRLRGRTRSTCCSLSQEIWVRISPPMLRNLLRKMLNSRSRLTSISEGI